MPSYRAALKPFYLDRSDLSFLFDQVNFNALFDAVGAAIVDWKGTGVIFNSRGQLVWNGVYGGAIPDAASAIAAFGSSYYSTVDLAGLRDPSGHNNNLFLPNANWGAVDQLFLRLASADHAHYIHALQGSDAVSYAAAKTYYSSYSNGVAAGGFNLGNALNTSYTIALGGAQHATDGTAMTMQSVVDYTPRMISLTTTTAGVTYDHWVNHAADPASSTHGVNEIYYDPSGVATVTDWGMLKTVADGGLGQVDTQARLAASAGQNDHFIGGLNPGVSPSNGFFVLFGQFFDHGLDFIGKGSGQTIKITLATDDPLYGMTGQDGRPVHEITINRATVQTVDAKGPEYINRTSPYIDQSQTYGSHEQLTALLREWVSTDGGTTFHAGMKLFDGQMLATAWQKADGSMTHDTLPTLDELRAHIGATGRSALTWEDVLDLRNRNAGGSVIATGQPGAGTSGSALLLDMNPRFDAGHLHGFYDLDGNGVQGAGEISYGTSAQAAAVDAAIAVVDAAVKSQYGALSTFGIDPATHKLTLHMETLPAGSPAGTPHTLDGANALYPFVNFDGFAITVPAGAVHDAVGQILLASVGSHYIAGDGRVNENFGLTSIHHVFHEEHNFQVQNVLDALHRQDVITGGLAHADLHGFQMDTGTMNAAGDFIYADNSVAWDANKVFNAAKLIVEMEYQHAAVDQYARNVSPNIQEFGAYATNVNSAINLEYSQAAFRFGHSTLRETIDTIDPSHGLTGKVMGYALHDAFLNPEAYQTAGAAAIILGMSHQQMNEVDEFVTPALNQGLLGQPLDLAAINLARGRDIGLPTLNNFREAIGLARYTNWTDFGQNMQHPSSLANFIAAYAFDGSMDKANAIIGLANGLIATGDAAAQGCSVDQANGFLSGDEVAGGAGTLAFNQIDTWLGGLAEIHQPGGLLGETFDKVFVNQIETLMDGDRFYYLYRLFGTQFGNEVGNGQLKDIVERNTGLSHLNGNIFGYADKYVELGAQREVQAASGSEMQTTGNEHKYGDIYDSNGAFVGTGALTQHPGLGVYTNGGLGNASDGKVVTIGGVQYIRDTRLADSAATQLNGGVNLDGTPNSGAESHEIIVGTGYADLIYGQGGDDTVYGEGGDDKIYGGYGIDRLYGGDGSDTIYGGDNPDLIDGGSGDDFLYGESSGSDINGNDQVIGGSGNDFISGGIGIDKLFGGTGDDHIMGDQDTDPFTHGDDGNDIVDGGSGTDVLYGDNGDDLILDGSDVDISFGGDGDDIMRVGDIAQALGAGPDEVLGGDGVTDAGNTPGSTGFDIMDFSLQQSTAGVVYDLDQQTNPLTAVNGQQTVPAAFQIEGLIGSLGTDTLSGDSGDNWIIGGSGNDILNGDTGNDIVVGGSLRLDTLIGKYESAPGVLSTYDHNNANPGITAAQQLEDARYDGASHRVGYTDQLAASGANAGIIDAANAQLGGIDYAKHFGLMLRSQQFKDLLLGDAAGLASQGTDTLVLAGVRSDYLVELVAFAGHDVVRMTSAAGGSDLIVDVDLFKFGDGTVVTFAGLMNLPPVITSNGGGAAAALSVAENSLLATTVMATDPNAGQALTYSISGGADAAKFQIDATTGVLSFLVAPNFEAPTDVGANNVYDVIVKVSDPLAAFDTQALAISVTNVDEAATGSLNIATYAIVGNNVTLNAASTLADPDAASMTLAYQWQSSLDGLTWTNIAGRTTPTLTTSGALTNRNLRLQASYTDAFGVKTVSSVETALVGTTAANTLNGTAGADLIFGLGGTDTLNGNGGNDTFVFRNGSGQPTAVNGGAGNDTIKAYDNGTTIGLSALTGVETITADGHAGVTIAGTNGADVLDFSTVNLIGIASINGGGGNDTITGSAGDDRIDGGAGNDALAGGGGNDVFLVGFGSGTDIFNGGTGSDTILATSNNTVINLGTLFGLAANSIETVSAGGFTDVHIAGTPSDDTLDFSGITLTGIAQIDGGNGNDTIVGSSGADTIYGGAGSDTLAGGAGADTFIYQNVSDSRGTTYDRLLDFDISVDKLDLTGTHTVFLPTITSGALNAGASFNSNLASVLTAATLSPNASRFFTPTTGTLGGHTFLVVDGNGIAGYQANQDWVFEWSGTLPANPSGFII